MDKFYLIHYLSKVMVCAGHVEYVVRLCSQHPGSPGELDEINVYIGLLKCIYM